MTRRFAGAVATAGMLMLLGPAAAMANLGRTDVILAGSQSAVDYHAEAAPAKPADGGTTIIGGNIQIASDRGATDGVAGDCDPDPRFGTHPRPDDEGCTWDEPVGSGQDFIAFGRHIAAQDVSPTGAATPAGAAAAGWATAAATPTRRPTARTSPVTTPTRESFNGRGGLDKDGNPFLEDRPVLDDEDLGFQITGARDLQLPRAAGQRRQPLAPPVRRGVRLAALEQHAQQRAVRRRGRRPVRRPDLGRGLEGPVRPRRRQPGLLHHRRLPAGDELRREDLPGDEAGVPAGAREPAGAADPPVAPAPTPAAAVAAAPAAGAVKGVTVRRGTARLAAVSTCPITAPVPLRVRRAARSAA